MATRTGAYLPRPRPLWPRWAAGAGLVAACSLGLSACGSAAASLKVSTASGPVGTVVTLTGNGGSGCVLDKNWFGFDFGRASQVGKVPATEMTTPLGTSSSAWSATFTVPSYLGGSPKVSTAAAVTPGHYEFWARGCSNKKLVKVPFTVTAGGQSPSPKYVAIAATVDGQGYWLAQGDGRVYAYGDAHYYGSVPAGQLSSPVVALARTYTGKGYWLATASGRVYGFGDARPYGSVPGPAPLAPIVSMAVTPNGKGYWLLAADGHLYTFGNARTDGTPSPDLAPFDAIGTRPAGGYVITASDDGAVYLYPGGQLLSGGGPGAAQSASLVGAAVTPSGNGAWQVGTDGGVITAGDAANAFYSSIPAEGVVLKAPVTAVAATPDGHGYWLLSGDGELFNFGDAGFFGSPVKAK